jgi:(E)-4-hydroxy-3-methylbut-2-enyl-diphosphate synthase
MSRYGDTPMGMVESAMEFLRIARDENYHQIVLSMKASNPQVMVQAYRLLIQQMDMEFGECYPLHLGVTEAGDGEDGRVKSAVGIGTLLEDGIGDTIRVSLTEDPELEIPVCKDLVKRYPASLRGAAMADPQADRGNIASIEKVPYDPFNYSRRRTFAVDILGDHHVPVVIADLSKIENIGPQHLESVGYQYDATLDKWNIGDGAADFIFTGHQILHFDLPGTVKVITYPAAWALTEDQTKYFPLFDESGYDKAELKSNSLNFVMLDCFSDETPINDFTFLDTFSNDKTVVLCLSSKSRHAMAAVRRMFMELMNRNIQNPAVIICDSYWQNTDEHLIHYATECGALLLDGLGDGICLGMTRESYDRQANNFRNVTGRNYLSNATIEQFINATAFSILQATRTRISKTEYISCPSCGRTLFDLQETTAKIRSVTNHLKGVKIAIMGCIVNGPGEMADADFGYVGSGVGKITLYKGKEIVKRNVDSAIAVDELVRLLKENGAWVEPLQVQNFA